MIVCVPVERGVTVTVPLLIAAVAWIFDPVAVGDTLNVPPLVLVAVNVVLVVGYVIVPEAALKFTVHAPLVTVNA